jgi:hypothetical protein
MAEAVHMRPSEGPCAIHDWPTDGLAARLVVAAREAHGKGGVNACVDCLARAREDAHVRARASGLRALELGDASRQRAHEVALYAARHENWYRPRVSTWVPGDRPEHVADLGDFRCAFSYSVTQGTLYRQLSISTRGPTGPGLPAPIAVWTIASWFGFTGAAASAEGLVERPAGDWMFRPVTVPFKCVVLAQEIGPAAEQEPRPS